MNWRKKFKSSRNCLQYIFFCQTHTTKKSKGGFAEHNHRINNPAVIAELFGETNK